MDRPGVYRQREEGLCRGNSLDLPFLPVYHSNRLEVRIRPEALGHGLGSHGLFYLVLPVVVSNMV